MKRKTIVNVLLLALLSCCLVFALVACGGNKYTVTFDYGFDADGDGTNDTITVEVDEGSLLERPADPSGREGYEFVGWGNLDGMWDFATDTVQEDMTLNAKWSVGGDIDPGTPDTTVYVNYDLGAHAAEDASAPARVSSTSGTVITLPEAPAAALGYAFTGWLVSGETEVREAGSSYTVSGTVAIVAQWTQVDVIDYEWEITKEPTAEAEGEITGTFTPAGGGAASTVTVTFPLRSETNTSDEPAEGMYNVVTTDSTCIEKGSTVVYYTIPATNTYESASIVVSTTELELAAHSYGNLIPADPATCTEPGMEAHFECSVCHKLFDEEKVEKTEEQLTIAAGHSYGNLIPEDPATCTEPGMKAHFKCSVCHKLFDEEKVEKTEEELTIAAGHSYGDLIPEDPATCAEPGMKEHFECSVCHKLFDVNKKETTKESLTIPATGKHVYAYTSYAGNTLLATCSVCKEDTITATLIFSGGNASVTGAPFGGELVVEVVGTNFVVTIPQCTYSLTGNAFTSWSDGKKEYEIGDALVIPAEQSATLTAQWEQTNSVDTAEEFLAALADSSISSITVANDIRLTQKVTVNRNVTIDLGGNTLTYFTAEGTPTGSEAVFNFEGTSEKAVTVTVRNGDIVFDVNNAADGTKSTMFVQHATLNLTNVDVKTDKTGIFVAIATLNMTGGSVTAEGVYAIGTNASVKKEDGTALYGPATINIKGTSGTPVTLTANGTYTSEYLNDGMGICFNAGGTLSLDYVNVIGARQGVMVRNGAAYISNSTITTKGACTVYGENLYWNGSWSEGSEVPMAALVIGDRAAGSYKGDAIVTLNNTQVIVADGATDDTKYIYLWADTEDGTAAQLIYACNDAYMPALAAESKIVCGNDAAEVTVEHDLGDLIAEKPATCTEAGMKAHYVCADCGTYFTENKVETTENALIIKALGHGWGTPAYADGTVTASCTRDNCEAVLSATVSVSGGDGIEGTTALTSEDFTVTNDGFTLKLPMSGFTAPDGKYFKAWQVGEVEYFPGELCDIENGATVTINAVWADFVDMVSISNVQIGKWGEGLPNSFVLSNDSSMVSYVGEYNGTLSGSVRGAVVQIRLDNGDFYFLRPDAEAAYVVNDSWIWRHGDISVQTKNGESAWGITSQDTADGKVDEGEFNSVRLAGTTKIEVSFNNDANTISVKESFLDSSGVEYTSYTYNIVNALESRYTVFFAIDYDAEAGESLQATDVEITYPEIAAAGEQWASAENTIQVGSKDGGYTPNGGWVSTLNKGEKVVLSGTQISTGTTNWQTVLVGLYSGSAPTIQFRADNYIIGAADAAYQAENWAFTMTNVAKGSYPDIEEPGDAYWAAFRNISTDCDVTISLDWTDESKIEVVMTFTGEVSEGVQDTFTQTYTVTSTAESGLADSYHYCLGYENAQITIDSIVRTHA